MPRVSFSTNPTISRLPESFPIHFDIYYPVCRKFIPRNGSKFCYCNRSERFHQTQGDQFNSKQIQIPNEIWNRRIHTRAVRENAFGQLQNSALYLRVDPAIDCTEINGFLQQRWSFPQPKLIMSIIGGTREFILEDRLERKFVNGIVDVAVRTDTWIITNGYNNGLVQLVGQAIYKTKIRDSKHKTVALAICKWGGVKNIEQLIKREKAAHDQDIRSDTSDTSDDEDDQTEVWKRKQYELNLDHTHYLMIDNGKYGSVDTKQYRTTLCNQIIQHPTHSSHIPAVTIVVDGGDATISNIYHDLRANIPVVIIKGTGRVADFFVHWLAYTKDVTNPSPDGRIYEIDELRDKTLGQQNSKTQTRVSPYEATLDLEFRTLADLFAEHQDQLEQELKNLLISDDDIYGNETSSPKITRLRDEMMYCLQPGIRSNITVFDLQSETDLSQAIFQIIVQSYKRIWRKKTKSDEVLHVDDLLSLTMDWDCIDIAKEFALENSLDSVQDIPRYFIRALQEDLFTFVFEFIRLGLNPVDIFFSQRFYTGEGQYAEFIRVLYSEKEIYEGKNELKHFIDGYKPSKKKIIENTHELNKTLRTIIGSYMHKLYQKPVEDEEANRYENGFSTKTIRSLRERRSIIRPDEKQQKDQVPRDCIMRDLFLWSILTNRVNMAKVFLSFMKYRICPALVATKVFKEYQTKAPHGELQDSYEESAEYFQQYAINCLDKCDDYDAEKACKLVLQENELYGNVTCLQVAADAKDRRFIAEPACVEAMSNVWYDKLHPNQARIRDKFSLIVGFFTLGLLAPAFVLYRDYEQQVGEIPRPTLVSRGINYCDSYALEFPRIIKSKLTFNRYLYQLKNFHESPLIKFSVHFIVYLFFLLLFSYVLLFQFNPPTATSPSIDWTEILVILLVSCMLVEEIHYFCSQDELGIGGKILDYFSDLLRSIRFLAIVLFYVGLILRFTYAGSEEQFVAARIVMAIDIELWWLCALSFTIAIEFLGPQLVAIAYMLKDLLFFVCIIAVVMIGYGVASRSVVYYPLINGFTSQEENPIDPSFDGRSVFRQVIAPVYFFLHGEFGSELDNLDTSRDAGWSIATHVVFAFHMLFVNILLTNLLIAMFSKRFEKVYDETRYIWHYQKYLFIREYYMRAPLIPPFSLIIDFYRLIRMFVFFIRHKCLKKPADSYARIFKMIPEDRKLIKEWRDSERASTYEYAQSEVREVFTKAPMEHDASSKEENDDMIDNQDDSAKIIENLRKVQENVRSLTTTIDEKMKEVSRSRRRSVMLTPSVGRNPRGQNS